MKFECAEHLADMNLDNDENIVNIVFNVKFGRHRRGFVAIPVTKELLANANATFGQVLLDNAAEVVASINQQINSRNYVERH